MSKRREPYVAVFGGEWPGVGHEGGGDDHVVVAQVEIESKT